MRLGGVVASAAQPRYVAAASVQTRADPLPDDEDRRPRPATLEVDVVPREPMPAIQREPARGSPRGKQWTPASVLVLAAVLCYLAVVLLVPIGALVWETFGQGIT